MLNVRSLNLKKLVSKFYEDEKAFPLFGAMASSSFFYLLGGVYIGFYAKHGVHTDSEGVGLILGIILALLGYAIRSLRKNVMVAEAHRSYLAQAVYWMNEDADRDRSDFVDYLRTHGYDGWAEVQEEALEEDERLKKVMDWGN